MRVTTLDGSVPTSLFEIWYSKDGRYASVLSPGGDYAHFDISGGTPQVRKSHGDNLFKRQSMAIASNMKKGRKAVRDAMRQYDPQSNVSDLKGPTFARLEQLFLKTIPKTELPRNANPAEIRGIQKRQALNRIKASGHYDPEKRRRHDPHVKHGPSGTSWAQPVPHKVTYGENVQAGAQIAALLTSGKVKPKRGTQPVPAEGIQEVQGPQPKRKALQGFSTFDQLSQASIGGAEELLAELQAVTNTRDESPEMHED